MSLLDDELKNAIKVENSYLNHLSHKENNFKITKNNYLPTNNLNNIYEVLSNIAIIFYYT